MSKHENRNRGNSKGEKEEPPPFLKTWNRIYAAIVLYTCALILALYLITVTLNR